MFTGIIKEIGRIENVVKGISLTKLAVRAEKIYDDVQPSDSISLNGVCLTLIEKKSKVLFFEAVKSTLAVTNLKRLRKGDFVNMEPCLKVGERLGGHFVLGHVDGEVKIRKIAKLGGYWQFEVEFPHRFGKFVVENGSVALEGISLTVKKVGSSYFTVDIIPFTYENTNLKYKRPASWLNVEFDYLLKHTLTNS